MSADNSSTMDRQTPEKGQLLRGMGHSWKLSRSLSDFIHHRRKQRISKRFNSLHQTRENSNSSLSSTYTGDDDDILDSCTISPEIMSTKTTTLTSQKSTDSTADATADADTDAGTTTTAKKVKSVQWSHLDIHYHDICLGDNPSVLTGPPITLSWKCVKSVDNISIDEYENKHPFRRDKEEFRLPRMIREDWLLDVGYSGGQIREASMQARKDAILRQKSGQNHVAKGLIMRAVGAMSFKMKRTM